MNPRYTTLLIAAAMAAVLSTSVIAKNDNGEQKKGQKREQKAKMTKEQRTARRAEQKAKMLQEFDKDGDGKLSKEEKQAAKDARKKQFKERKGNRKGKGKGKGGNVDKAAE